MGNWIRVHLAPDGQPSAMMGVHLSAQYWPPSGPSMLAAISSSFRQGGFS